MPFPLLLLVLVAYNVIVFVTDASLAQNLYTFSMMSGALWSLTISDALLLGGLMLLFMELIQATRTGASSVLNHAFSMVVFIACLVEFLLVPQAANSTFFIIMALCLVDVIGGYTITIATARRDVALGGHLGD